MIVKTPPPSQLILWLLLALPGAVVVGRFALGMIGYGEALHQSGDWSVRLLIVTLALTPLRLAFPKGVWSLWLLRRRRDIGVACFAYAALHLGIYLGRKAEAPMLIVREGLEPGMAVGWIALVALAALAITSNNAAVRRLGSGWKRLHRLIYPAAALTMAHWLLTAFDLRQGLIHAAILVGVVASGTLLQRRRTLPRAG